MSRPSVLGDDETLGWLSSHRHWRLDKGHLVRELRTSDYPRCVAIVDAQVAIAERLDHHPILTVGWCELRIELWTHDRGGLTTLDLDYAEQFDALVDRDFVGAVL